MNENLNLAEILKDCPKGTKLWSPLCGECELYSIGKGEKFLIHVRSLFDRDVFSFMKDGRFYENGGVCVLFPSREQWDWSKFQRQFKDGDVIYVNTRMFKWVSIFKKETKDKIVTYTDYNLDTNNFHGANNYDEMTLCQTNAILEKRIATEEEKQKLFKAIKEHGYTWNAETKTLEKEKKYKFDITTLKPFDQVLVRNVRTDKWHIGFFEKIDKEEPKYDTAYSSFRHCIPYNDETKHLLGKTEMEPEFYRVDDYLL